MSALNVVDGKLVPIASQSAAIQEKPVNVATVLVVIIPAILIVVFLWFYLAPLLRRKRVASESPRPVDPEMSAIPVMEQHDAHNLIAWMRRGSRGRFVDTQGCHGGRPRPQTNYARFSFFGRSSIIPNLSPVTPPPAYATRPGTPAPDYQFSPTIPSPLAPPRANSGTPIPTVRFFGPGRRTSFRPATVEPVSPSPLGRAASSATILRPPTATRSVSDSTLHPSTVWLPAPSRALVYDREPPRSSTMVRLGSSPVVSIFAGDARSNGKEAPGPF